MASGAKPISNTATIPQDKTEAFIAEASTKRSDISLKIEELKIVTTLRFDLALLRQIDQAAKKRGVSRTACIMMAASRAVREGL